MLNNLKKISFSLQLIRHYLVQLMRFVMAIVMGYFIEPQLFGSFIVISFSCTLSWLFFDFGLKQRALQCPNQINLSEQKGIHLLLSFALSLLLFLSIFVVPIPFFSQKVWLFEFALITPLVAISIPSYVMCYWKSDIKKLAKLDFISQITAQTISIILLINNKLEWALSTSFILPLAIHALLILKLEPVEIKLNFSFLKLHGKPAFFLGLADGLQQLRTKLDSLLLVGLSSPTQLALYNRAYAIPHHANQFMQAVVQPIFIPHLAQKGEFNTKSLPYLMIFAAILTFLMNYILAWGIQSFWKPEWFSLIPLLPGFLLWAFTNMILGWHETLLKSKQKNLYLVIRNSILTLIILSSIFFFYADLVLLSKLIGLLSALACLVESFVLFKNVFDSDFRLPISELIALGIASSLLVV